MKSYLAALDTGIAARVAQWKAQPGPMLFYPAMKQLTLDLAALPFLGADIGPEVDEITRAFVDMVAASIAPIRRPLPGTQMARGVKAANASSPTSRNRFRSGTVARQAFHRQIGARLFVSRERARSAMGVERLPACSRPVENHAGDDHLAP